MRQSLINCDIGITTSLRAQLFDAGLTVCCLYWNGSIPAETVLTVRESSKAFIAATPEAAIDAAEAAIFGGL